VSQNVKHLVSEGSDIILHREMEDPNVFIWEAFPDTLEERRGNRAMALRLSTSLAGQHVD
jgi:hypothetical protein